MKASRSCQPLVWLIAMLLGGAAPQLTAATPVALAGERPLQLSPELASDPGAVGIFFDADGLYTRHRSIAAFVPFHVYVVTFAPPGGMEAYGFRIELPVGAVVSGGRLLPPGATDFDPGDDNFIVGTGGICQGLTPTFVLVTYPSVLFLTEVEFDVPICLFGEQPSSFPSGAPG